MQKITLFQEDCAATFYYIDAQAFFKKKKSYYFGSKAVKTPAGSSQLAF